MSKIVQNIEYRWRRMRPGMYAHHKEYISILFDGEFAVEFHGTNLKTTDFNNVMPQYYDGVYRENDGTFTYDATQWFFENEDV